MTLATLCDAFKADDAALQRIEALPDPNEAVVNLYRRNRTQSRDALFAALERERLL